MVYIHQLQRHHCSCLPTSLLYWCVVHTDVLYTAVTLLAAGHPLVQLLLSITATATLGPAAEYCPCLHVVAGGVVHSIMLIAC